MKQNLIRMIALSLAVTAVSSCRKPDRPAKAPAETPASIPNAEKPAKDCPPCNDNANANKNDANANNNNNPNNTNTNQPANNTATETVDGYTLERTDLGSLVKADEIQKEVAADAKISSIAADQLGDVKLNESIASLSEEQKKAKNEKITKAAEEISKHVEGLNKKVEAVLFNIPGVDPSKLNSNKAPEFLEMTGNLAAIAALSEKIENGDLKQIDVSDTAVKKLQELSSNLELSKAFVDYIEKLVKDNSVDTKGLSAGDYALKIVLDTRNQAKSKAAVVLENIKQLLALDPTVTTRPKSEVHVFMSGNLTKLASSYITLIAVEAACNNKLIEAKILSKK